MAITSHAELAEWRQEAGPPEVPGKGGAPEWGVNQS